MRRVLAVVLTVAVSGVLALLIGELACRLILGKRVLFLPVLDERNLAYRYDATLGWFPGEHRRGWFEDTRRIFYSNNAQGFRDVEHGPKARPRIAFIGDSFVWGYDVDQNERFTDRLQAMMPRWEMLNLGVSGYATDQEYLILGRFFDLYQPDIVLVVFCDNDHTENSMNVVHKGYHKPYFVTEDGRLQLRGVPVVESANYRRLQLPVLFKSYLVVAAFNQWVKYAQRPTKNADPTLPLLAAMQEFVRSKGARFIVGLIDPDPEMELFARANGIEVLLLDTQFREPRNSGHWTAAGHAEVAGKLADYLQHPHQ